MKQLKQFIKTTLLGGLLVILPVAVLLIVAQWVFELVRNRIRPLTEYIAGRSTIHGIMADVIVVILLVFICFGVGVFVRTRLGSLLFTTVERGLLSRIPGYKLVKETVASFMVHKKSPFETVVLVRLFNNDTWMTGFVTDSHENGFRTVFVPTAPSPTSGFVYHVAPENLQYLTADTADAVRSIISFGVGSSTFFPSKRITHVPSPREDVTRG